MVEEFNIMGYRFQIITEKNLRSYETYSIRFYTPDDEVFWLVKPQRSYETFGGCYEAILLYLNEVTKSEL